MDLGDAHQLLGYHQSPLSTSRNLRRHGHQSPHRCWTFPAALQVPLKFSCPSWGVPQPPLLASSPRRPPRGLRTLSFRQSPEVSAPAPGP